MYMSILYIYICICNSLYIWMIIIYFCRPFLDWVTHQTELNHRSVSQQIKSRSGNDHAEQLRTKAEEDWGNVAIHHFLKTKDIRLEHDFDSRLVEVVTGCAVVDFDRPASLRPFHLHLPFGLCCLRLDVTWLQPLIFFCTGAEKKSEFWGQL